jgi:tetratricopeptide (TPR) repeat protein
MLDSAPSARRWRRTLALGALVVLTAIAFLPVLANDFVTYDDPHYVTQNPVVRLGLTGPGVRWAFTTGHAANWHPLTWLSHMLDVELFGLEARGHHLTSLVLHVASALVLLLVLHDLTGHLPASLAAAALFAVHPTRVESVAWIAERKDVLAGLLGMLTIGAYAAYVRRPRPAPYVAALALFAAGLMAKPMLVSLPLVLLLLDVWPLRRLDLSEVSARTLRALVWEKLPFLSLAAASAVVTFLVQRAGGAVGALESYPLGVRLANALVAAVRYLRQLVWPTDLAVFHPHPGASLPAGLVVGAAALLLGLTAAAWRARHALPEALVGWGWFVVTLIPVSGLVQVGLQARADRYTYIPFVGLFIAVVWGLRSLARRVKGGPVLAAVTLGIAIVACAFATRREVRHWRDSETLFRRAIEVTGDNAVAQYSLGHLRLEKGDAAEAIPYFREALRIAPAHVQALQGLGRALVLLGRCEEAAAVFAEAIRHAPGDVGSMNNLAVCLLREGDSAGALRWYAAAAAKAPHLPHLQHVQGMLLLAEGRTAEAVARLEKAVALDPSRADWAEDLEGARDLRDGREGAAVARLRRRLSSYPPRSSSAGRSTSSSTSPAPPGPRGDPGPGGASPRP